jgi:isoamylase
MVLSGRIDSHPTHEYGDFRLRAGKAIPLGAYAVPGGINFAVFSRYATACTLVLFEKGEAEPLAEVPIPPEFSIGNIYAIMVFDLEPESIEYGFRMDGPDQPHRGHRFDRSKVLLDPYARLIGGQEIWREPQPHDAIFPHRAQIPRDDYAWEDDRPLDIPIEDLVIYEMHVRGFTAHPSAAVKYPGTFGAIREKIPYFKDLGVNCVELMPVFEFDEFEYNRVNPMTGERLVNYWGYSTIGFFAPKAGYAATGRYGMAVDELKTLVKDLHANGIEVILDVVFNHTAEGNELGPTISYRGIDNKTYYMLAPDGSYLNFSGTGNTMNCNNPVVRNLVMDCLRYWVSEYHIDGFRFDLASILGRDQFGMPLANPPLIEMMAYDPILAKCKLIAEAWDAGGMYQVGTFPAYGRWTEWNGKYRDAVRRFIKGDGGVAWEVSERIQGSPDLYASRGPWASINFVTCHDGFTLMDLYSYNEKHNLANGEENRDGTNENYSWNCGVEGPTKNSRILRLRRQMVKNAVAILMVSQGVPMIYMGDEIGHTKLGNNNTYCHDNELNWFNWEQTETDGDLLRFFKNMIAFRHAHPVLRNAGHFQHRDYVGCGYPDISWHTTRAWVTDWSDHVRTIAFMLSGEHAKNGTTTDDYIYVAMNMHWENHVFEVPRLPQGRAWHIFADTGEKPPYDIFEPGAEPMIHNPRSYGIKARSIVILVGKKVSPAFAPIVTACYYCQQ